MHPALQRNLYLVKEHVGMFKASHNYDIFDLSSGDELLQCREPDIGGFTKLLRFTDYKRYTPFRIVLTDLSGATVVEVSRGISLFLSQVHVTDRSGEAIGGFQQKFLSLGGRFSVMDENGQPVCDLKGSWTGWDFRFMAGETQLAHVTKKWTGLGKEMFTSADNYVLDISPEVPQSSEIRKLIFAAVMCIDLVLKE